jgi:hypothetical protein
MSSATSSSGYRLGYARVSTLQQDESLQRDALVAAGVDRISSTTSPGSWSPVRRSTISCRGHDQATASWSGDSTVSVGRYGT